MVEFVSGMLRWLRNVMFYVPQQRWMNPCASWMILSFGEVIEDFDYQQLLKILIG